MAVHEQGRIPAVQHVSNHSPNLRALHLDGIAVEVEVLTVVAHARQFRAVVPPVVA